ncbi:MAG: DUF2683 family protein [Paludibacter sp.]
MARVAGITIEKDTHGNARYARIDLRKFGELLNPFLKEVGVDTEVSPYNKKFVEKIRKGEEQIANGNTHKLDLNDLWK